jgi:hypothetical protein
MRFGLVMVPLFVAVTRDLRHDPLVRRHDRSQRAAERAADRLETEGERIFLDVEPRTAEHPRRPKAGEASGTRAKARGVARTDRPRNRRVAGGPVGPAQTARDSAPTCEISCSPDLAGVVALHRGGTRGS